MRVGSVLALAALSVTSCGIRYPGREPLPGWAFRPSGAFAHLQVTFGRPKGNELEGFDVALSELLDATVEHEFTNPGVRYWATIATPRRFDFDAIRALATATPERSKRYYEMYIDADWDFDGLTATLRGTGQRFPVSFTAESGEQLMFVHWRSTTGQVELAPN
jgi:hypothetical protein